MKKSILIILITFTIASCGGGGKSNKKTELENLIKQQTVLNEKINKLREEIKTETGDYTGVKLVAAETLSPTPFRHYIEIQARVDGDESVNVSPRTQGTVASISVNIGDKVSKGQVLATLDDIVIRQTLGEVETQFNFAKSVYEKQKNLWDQKIGSEIQFLSAKNNKESLEKRLAAINEQMDLTRIKSPVTGTVDYVALKVGQAVAPGLPAFTVVNLSSLKVKGEVGEAYAGKIDKGNEVTLFFPDLSKEITTRVGFASRSIGLLNRTFHVEVPLKANESEGLSPNMVVVMKINDYKNDTALVLPVDVLQRSGEGYFVMTANEKSGKLIASRRKVKEGKIYNGMAEITSGLSTTDQIITRGYRDLTDGQEIRIK